MIITNDPRIAESDDAYLVEDKFDLLSQNEQKPWFLLPRDQAK